MANIKLEKQAKKINKVIKKHLPEMPVRAKLDYSDKSKVVTYERANQTEKGKHFYYNKAKITKYLKNAGLDIDEIVAEANQLPETTENTNTEKAEKGKKVKISYNQAKKILSEIKNFVPKNQYKILLQNIADRKEENSFFREKIEELHGIIKNMPKTKETDGQGDNATAYLHYFMGGGDWYMTEKDMGDGKEDSTFAEQIQAGGYRKVDFLEYPFASTGYFSIPEIDSLNLKLNDLQLDLYWDAKTIAEIKGNESKEEETVVGKSNNMMFLFKENNKQANDLLLYLKTKNITAKTKLVNSIVLLYKNKEFKLLDNGGEFKLDYLPNGDDGKTFDYFGQFEFRTATRKNKDIDDLAQEVSEEIISYYNDKLKSKSKKTHSNQQPTTKTTYETNREIEKLIDQKGDKPENYTLEEKQYISKYAGYGGTYKEMEKAKEDNFNKGFNFEYFTPNAISSKMVGLAMKHGYKQGMSVLETSAGVGAFLQYFTPETPITTYEINPYSHKILKVLYPNATHNLGDFETAFMTGRRKNTPVGNKVANLPKYDLVIGNPPFGEYKGFHSIGEAKVTKAQNFQDYFITRGLDLLKPGGLLVYIIGAEIKAGGNLWLAHKTDKKVKQLINKKAELLDAYKLPEGLFDRTGVTSEIVVFKKK